MSPFFYWWSFHLCSYCKRMLLIVMAWFSSQLVSYKNIFFTQISSCIKVFNSEKSGASIFIDNVMFMVGYYNKFPVVWRQIIGQLYFKDNLVNHLLFHVIDWCPYCRRPYHYSISLWLSWITNYKNKKSHKWGIHHQEGITEGRIWPIIRRVDALLLYHMPTVMNKIIWKHQTLIMLE